MKRKIRQSEQIRNVAKSLLGNAKWNEPPQAATSEVKEDCCKMGKIMAVANQKVVLVKQQLP